MQHLFKCLLMILFFVACKGENCEVVSTKSLEWNETTELGVPSEVFSSSGGDCATTLAWDWDSNEVVTIKPETGTGEVHIIVDIDTSSARYVNQAFYYDNQYSFPSTLLIDISKDELLIMGGARR